MSPFGCSFHDTALRSAGLTWLRALIGICALALQMLAPITAHSENSGEWMVICGEDGAVLMQVQLSDDEPAACPICGDCKACQLGVSAGGILTPTLRSRDFPAIEVVHGMHGGSVAPNPAQFWHENRGPPLVHTILSDSAWRLFHAVTLSQGGAPWT
ncbi:DUF2946 family protein [Parasedimentitalea psychrophila]|uniref:DUF2946 domain-containing protein n=1 Tax=Parasedimentitalea psychrophila TaxID=2997337 RepID=A0A9Y2KZP6_9RHOB|nr:hypothetical protein [Parasedimentitalea psychrophila]WIY26075.1 hypothetical protein QPJ95_03860 [Parasedimentitalea psychrophila]